MSVTESDAPVRPPIDPRLRARRIAVRRDEGRRRLRRVVVAGVLAAVLVLGAAATQSPLLDVDRITVVGAQHVSVDAVRAATSVHVHRPMTSVDLARARAGVLALPWVQSVSVRREWPSTVKVVVTERTPVAVVPDGAAGFALVDGSGHVLETTPAPTPGFPVLGGVAAPGAPGASMGDDAADALSVAGQLLPSLAPKVATITLAPDGVELDLVGGGKVRLGPAQDVLAKLVAADTVLTQVDIHHLCTLDVRVASAPSLTQGSGCA